MSGLLENPSYSERFCRIGQLMGTEAPARLRQARVAVFGLGAVGSYAVEAMARAGAGYLRLVDFDVIRPSNFNRQLYALEGNLGRLKTDVAGERVAAINPDCIVDKRNMFIDHANVDELLDCGLSVVIDAIDSLTPKVTLLAAAVNAGLPTVSSMGAASRLDPRRLALADIAATRGCPLARFVRKKLRRRGVTTGVWCVYADEPAAVPPAGYDTEASMSRGRRRRVLGSLPTLTGMFGLWAAHQAINLIVAPQTQSGN